MNPALRRRTAFLCAVIVTITCSCSFLIRTEALTTNLRVAYPRQMAPYQFTDESGNSYGRHVDLLNEVARYKRLSIEYIPMDTRTQCLEALGSGQADLVMGIMEMEWPGLVYSTEISSSTVCLAARNEIAERYEASNIKAFTGVMERGTMSTSLLFKLAAKNWIMVDSQIRVLGTEQAGEADLMVGVKNSLLYQLQELDMMDDYTIVRNSIGTAKYYIVAGQNDKDLIRIIDDGIAMLRANGTFDRISDAWLVDTEEYKVEKLKLMLFRVALAVVVLFGIYFIFNRYTQSLLKTQVAIKTSELLDANDSLETQLLQIRSANVLRNQLVERSHSGMVMIDEEQKITMMNHSACLLAGISKPTIGQDISDIPVFGDLFRTYGHWHIFEGDNSVVNHIYFFRDSTGVERNYRCSVYRTQANQSLKGAILVAEDITEEEKERQAIFEHEKNRALNRIVAGIAHEIKNPLMSIRTFATLPPAKRDSPQAMEAFSKYVPGEVERIDRLVESLIHYAKPAKGHVSRVNVNQILQECFNLAQATMREEGIVFEIDLTGNVDICGDQDQLRQIFTNIIINAVESMREKLQSGVELAEPLRLSVTTKCAGGKIDITIRDEGMGMSSDQQARCTEPFFTTKKRGVGMGLAVTAQFVQQNGGRLRIASEEGADTSICVSFHCFEPESPGGNDEA